MGRILKRIGGVVLAIVAAGMFMAPPEDDFAVTVARAADPAGAKPEADAPRPAYEIGDLAMERDAFSDTITGILTTATDRDLSYIQVEINLYDADGVQVASTMANTNNLAAGGRWRFRAVAVEEFDTFRIEGVTAF